MGKLQSDVIFVPKKLDTSAPEIPPRMKKKGPALPEKPPHIRAKFTSSQKEPLHSRNPNPESREVLVAASKAGRERTVDKRQREPAMLLKPTSDSPAKGNRLQTDECLIKKEVAIVCPKNYSLLWASDDTVPLKHGDASAKKIQPLQQPVLLIPRNLLTSWGPSPISYALWMQRDAGRGAAKQQLRQCKSDTSGTSSARVRSGSVTRSDSLTSQGSSSSDSGVETFPKSALKKHRRSNVQLSNKDSGHPGRGIIPNRKMEPKKNVTFNAFATVQLMEE